MELKTVITILWNRKASIGLTWLIVFLAALNWAAFRTPVFETQITLRIATSSSGTLNYTDYMYSERLLNTYVEIANSQPVLNDLVARLDLRGEPEIKAEAIPETELMQVTVTHQSPETAVAAANTLGEILIERSKELYAGEGKSTQSILGEQLAQAQSELDQARLEYEAAVSTSPTESPQVAQASLAMDLKERTYTMLLDQYEEARVREALRSNLISVVEPAIAPTEPAGLSTPLILALGMVLGLGLGAAAALMMENLNPGVHTLEQAQELTGLPGLARIPTMRVELPAWLAKIPFLKRKPNPFEDLPVADAFLRLHVNLYKQAGAGLKCVLVTSPEPGEGKSVIVKRLAVTAARRGQRVIVLDGDLRLPKLHHFFETRAAPGLNEFLMDQARLEEILVDSIQPGIQFIPAGNPEVDPAVLLSADRISRLIPELKERCDFMVIDSPAVLAVTDAIHLATVVDGTLLVVNRARTRANRLVEALRLLQTARANLLGLALTEAGKIKLYPYYYSSVPAAAAEEKAVPAAEMTAPEARPARFLTEEASQVNRQEPKEGTPPFVVVPPEMIPLEIAPEEKPTRRRHAPRQEEPDPAATAAGMTRTKRSAPKVNEQELAAEPEKPARKKRSRREALPDPPR